MGREQIDRIVTKGIGWLKTQQKANGGYGKWGPASSALALMALLDSGVTKSCPAVTKAVSYLIDCEPTDSTYFRSLTIMALNAVGEKASRIQERVQADTQWLVEAQGKDADDPITYGGWGHTSHPKIADSSNSLFAMLALHDAMLWGEVPFPRFDRQLVKSV